MQDHTSCSNDDQAEMRILPVHSPDQPMIHEQIVLQRNGEDKAGRKMKVLLVCSGGYSTGILVRKIQKYCEENAPDTEVAAIGINTMEDEWKDFDCVLLAPQISYHRDEIMENIRIPLGMISGMDYGTGCAKNIIRLAQAITKGKREI